MKRDKETNNGFILDAPDSLCSVSVSSALDIEKFPSSSGEMNVSSNNFDNSETLSSRMPNPSMLEKTESKAAVSFKRIGMTLTLGYS